MGHRILSSGVRDICVEIGKHVRWYAVRILWPGNAEKHIISQRDRNGGALNSLMKLYELLNLKQLKRSERETRQKKKGIRNSK